MLTLVIFTQYAITKSSVKPWHGNHVLLLWTLVFGLLLEGLYLIKYKTIANIFLISIFVANIAINLLIVKQSTIIDINKRGFGLVVLQPYSLTPIRQYIQNHPGTYVVADWEIGRPLALENHYSSSNGQTMLKLSPFKKEDVSALSGKMVIRATGITQTVPDWSDEVLAKYNSKFESVEDFKDKLGRIIYQIGYIRKIEYERVTD